MEFNRECKFLDMNKMDSKVVVFKGVSGRGKETKRIFYHPCLSEYNPDYWISKCPKDCPYFE